MHCRTSKLFAVVVLLVLSLNQLTFACGPFFTEAVFVFTVHPAYPLERFARGEIGVIQPSYARSYLYVAYRYLSNSPFTPQEQKALTQLWDERLNLGLQVDEDSWIKAWTEARKKVAGVPDISAIQVYRNREKPNQYETYLNCTKDSFDTAVTTLNERINNYGADSAAVRSWVEAQDQVFSNCGGGQTLPSPPPPESTAPVRADRAYQIAAANFYSANFIEAKKDFSTIASDNASPWQSTATYLVARTLIRQASLGEEKDKKPRLSEAETQLRKIIANKNFSQLHAASNRLLDLVRLRLYPSVRMHELAHTLMARNANDHLKQDLWDYTVLLDGILDSEQAAKPTEELRSDDLTDWLSTFQGNSNDDLEHAFSRWQSTHNPAWLMAVLSKLDGKSQRTPDVIREALNIKPNSAAFATSSFHASRLLIDSGKYDEARSLIDRLMKENRTQFDTSTLNLLIDQRMMLATSLEDFLNHVPRVPAALSWNDDGREIPEEPGDSDEFKSLRGKPLFDSDAAKVFNTQLPLSLLKEAVESEALPPHLRRDLTQAVWIRSVLLGDYKTADELVPTLKTLVPVPAKLLDGYLQAAEPAKRFAALYVWLKTPGIEPIVDAGIGRESPLNEQDSYRDNWWCAAAITPGSEPVDEDNQEIASFTTSSLSSPVFLTEQQRATGKSEWSTINSLGAMPNYISKQVIQWATRNSRDPRVPEALHLSVNSTRYGCTDQETGRWSKAAFDLLHRRYPNTTWARKTKYWFQE